MNYQNMEDAVHRVLKRHEGKLFQDDLDDLGGLLRSIERLKQADEKASTAQGENARIAGQAKELRSRLDVANLENATQKTEISQLRRELAEKDSRLKELIQAASIVHTRLEVLSGQMGELGA
jgi:uncharacterized coiled-coil DUF342 family protein